MRKSRGFIQFDDVEEQIRRAIYFLYYVAGHNTAFISDYIFFVWNIRKSSNSLSKNLVTLKKHFELEGYSAEINLGEK